MSKKILLFSGSTSENSINAKLLNFCQQHMLENITSTWVDIIDYPLPEYSIDLENTEGIPSYAKAFKTLLKSHDGIIISCPEHNGLPPVAFNCTFDVWG
jgi:NAD(P)H-dependent FMN reductase